MRSQSCPHYFLFESRVGPARVVPDNRPATTSARAPRKQLEEERSVLRDPSYLKIPIPSDSRASEENWEPPARHRQPVPRTGAGRGPSDLPTGHVDRRLPARRADNKDGRSGRWEKPKTDTGPASTSPDSSLHHSERATWAPLALVVVVVVSSCRFRDTFPRFIRLRFFRFSSVSSSEAETSARAPMDSLSSAAAASSRRFPRFSGAGIDARRGNPIGEVRVVCGCKDREDRAGSGASRGALRCGFGDDGHVRYYGGRPRFGRDEEGRKEVGKAEIEKGLKGLAKGENFSEFRWMERRGGGEVIEGREKPISEAAEVLLKQLEQLKAEEKELKRKIKEQKAKLKAERKKVMMDSELSSSSSSSSESSDSECGEVIDMGCVMTEVLVKEESNNAGSLVLPNGVLYHEATVSGPSNVAASGAVTKRIEVCMGKKCKNTGGPALLEEFKNTVGVEGAVVECKCLGKCRDGPNVRVSNSLGEDPAAEADDSVRIPGNPLLIGVSLEDVDAIVAKYLGHAWKEKLMLWSLHLLEDVCNAEFEDSLEDSFDACSSARNIHKLFLYYAPPYDSATGCSCSDVLARSYLLFRVSVWNN
ncbi:hypothetical protein NL676_020554 [Syzygium grande]|nr:hypothetical protein NL676_020554 [Syzygium grande]